jgi:hypothetical protein
MRKVPKFLQYYKNSLTYNALMTQNVRPMSWVNGIKKCILRFVNILQCYSPFRVSGVLRFKGFPHCYSEELQGSL